MFARFTRLPLRRCIHTSTASSNSFSRTKKVVLAATAATTTYMTWRLTWRENQIALDSEHGSATVPRSTTTPTRPQPSSTLKTTSNLQAPDGAPADSGFLPDPEQAESPAPGILNETDTNEEASTSSDDGASPSGAFNPQTGEINWDCPCLGGMAHGPCGPEFKEAFSCFVFSEVEPKGIDCVEKFKAMQNCFRAHPEVYADEIMDDDDDEEPANVETTADLPPPEQSSENIVASTLQPSTTKKPHLQKAAKDS